MLTKEEENLLNRLAKPPKCMHAQLNRIIETETHWKCGDCGLVAKKSIEIEPGVFIGVFKHEY